MAVAAVLAAVAVVIHFVARLAFAERHPASTAGLVPLCDYCFPTPRGGRAQVRFGAGGPGRPPHRPPRTAARTPGV